MTIEEFDGNCSRCKEELDFPLYCKECKVWLCSNCLFTITSPSLIIDSI